MESDNNQEMLTVHSDMPGLIGICQDNIVIIRLFDNPLFIGQLKPDVNRSLALSQTLEHVENDIKMIILRRMLSGLMDNQDMPDDMPDGLYPFDMKAE